VGGQWLDLDAEAANPTLEELEQIHRRKTAALLVAAVRLGARAARADTRQLAALTAYAGALGLAFQIADDLLDVTGRPAVTGKHAGHDRERDKATFVTVLGEAHARRRGLRETECAIDALARVGLDVPPLVSLARFAIERDR
ncbi:MAG: polyprenyl synthetase family protein, partial [Longimicrobiales bacterium]